MRVRGVNAMTPAEMNANPYLRNAGVISFGTVGSPASQSESVYSGRAKS